MKNSDLQTMIGECLNEVLGESGRDPEPEVGSDGLVTVIEVDQWTSTGKFETIPFDELTLDKIHGGDADAVKRIGIGSLQIHKVPVHGGPRIGQVWLAKGPDGLPFLWKARYDSSD
jgi:hypothetical protein